jgi:hypothetical protein
MAEIPLEMAAPQRSVRLKPYPSDFAAIRELALVNNQIFTQPIDVTTTIAATFQELSAAISRLRVTLPTHRSNAKRGAAQAEVPHAEVRFTRLWDSLFERLSAIPTFGSALSDDFIPRLRIIQSAYSSISENIAKQVASRTKQIADRDAVYSTTALEYQMNSHLLERQNAFCRESGQSLTSDLEKFTAIAMSALSSFADLAAAKQEGLLAFEKCLLEFEKIDQNRADEIDKAFRELIGHVGEMRASIEGFGAFLREGVAAISSQADVGEAIDRTASYGEAVSLSWSPAHFSFDVTHAPGVDPNRLFQAELGKSTAGLIEDHEGLPGGRRSQ